MDASVQEEITNTDNWAQEELVKADFGDKRLTKRFIQIMSDIAAQPEASVPQACGSEAASKATYRFLDNENVTPEAIRASHRDKTVERVKEYKTVLAIQDATSLNYVVNTHNSLPHTTACSQQVLGIKFVEREVLNASYIEKWEPENLLVNMEFDSFTLSGECAAILHEPLRMEAPDLLCVAGHGTFTGPDLSHPRFLIMEDAEGKGAYCLVILIGMSKPMPSTSKAHTNLTPLPMLPQETLYIGIDVGKFRHIAGFLSRTLLVRHKQFEGCPTFAFEQSREGFRSFVDRIRFYVPLEQAVVLLEHTGHYHRLLEQYLLELDITVYRIHVQKRADGMMKTDKRDALGLANRLYTQLELGAQVADKMQFVRRIVPPTSAAAQLQGVMRHRYELSHMSTQYRNKLTAICDELFPELVQVFHDPNLPTALAFRSAFPTPHAIALASLNDLRAVRQSHFPSDAQLLHLQQLAKETIGVTDLDRQRGLVLEQGLLIKELQLIQEHLENLQTTITDIVQNCREGQILLSIPPIGPIQAATIIATVGNIANFAKACELKSYFGWAPRKKQTGVCLDQTNLSKRGVRPMKQMLFLMAARATTLDCEWARIYQRLLPRLCTYDERVRDYRGKKKVLGRIAGQMASLIYAFLKTDQETLSQVPPGASPPPPMLYDREIHRKHQEGSYRSLKPSTLPRKILQLPSKS